jgi:RNase P subunit RPR2
MEEHRPGTEDPPLGSCPACRTEIPSTNLLIRYEPADGWPRLFATCPQCDNPVAPE